MNNIDNNDEGMPDSGTIANAMLAAGDTTYSSIANFVDCDLQRGIELMKYAMIKRTEAQELVKQLEQQLEAAKGLVRSNEAAISYTAKHLKIGYPFSLQLNSDTAILYGNGEIQLIPLVACG